jgi:Predicted Zn-dependent protease (DUF2268)
MKIIILIALALCLNLSPLQAQIEVITSDITNFWMAFDSVQTTSDTTKQKGFIQKLYLDKASLGLKYAIDFQQATASDWLQMANNDKVKLLRIRPFTLSVLSQKVTLDAKLARFKTLYPDFKEGNIYFIMGTGVFGGRTTEDKVVIGAEVIANEKPDWAVSMVLHEFVHTQQKIANDALLSHSIMEGMADFVAELVNEEDLVVTHPGGYIDFGNKNEKAVWIEFKKFMGSSEKNKFFDWLYGNKGRSIDEISMRDLGYFVGYKICKAYYAQAADKSKALKDMIEMDFSKEETAKAFLIQSGYAPDGDKKFIKNLVFAPYVEKEKNIKKVQYGYAIKGENVVFTFEIPKSQDISTIAKVTIAGSFNGWNPNDDNLSLAFAKNRQYTLTLPKSTFEKGKTQAFKFVINGRDWQNAPETALNVDVQNNRNIVLVVE